MRRHHELKIAPQYFGHVCAGLKNFEIRKNDRDFRVGDTVRFYEWNQWEGYSGSATRTVTISYVLKDVPEYGLAPGFCIFGWNN